LDKHILRNFLSSGADAKELGSKVHHGRGKFVEELLERFRISLLKAQHALHVWVIPDGATLFLLHSTPMRPASYEKSRKVAATCHKSRRTVPNLLACLGDSSHTIAMLMRKMKAGKGLVSPQQRR
jgi:hypothetical protein